MAADNVSVLNDLISHCKDAEQIFREAARDVRDEKYQKVFLGFSSRMGEFARVLQEQVTKLGGKPRTEGSLAGGVHNAWVRARSLVNLHHTAPVLLEVERSEESLLDRYERAIESGLPTEIKDLAERQVVEIIEIRNHLKDMELGGKGDAPPLEKKITP